VGRPERRAPERREHGVGLAVLGAQLADVVHDGRSGVAAQLDPRLRAGVVHAPGAAAGIGRDVAREMDLLGADLSGQLHQLALRRAVADHEPRASVAKGAIEVLEALEHELRARPGPVTPGKDAIVEAENGHDTLVGVEGGAQGGVIVQAQIAAKPDEGGHPECLRRAPAARLTAVA